MIQQKRKKERKNMKTWGAWLAPSVKRATLDFRAVSSSPTLGVEIT